MHTPTPWTIGENDSVRGPSNELVCNCSLADAAQITLSVNNLLKLANLVDTLSMALEIRLTTKHKDRAAQRIVNNARALLAELDHA